MSAFSSSNSINIGNSADIFGSAVKSSESDLQTAINNLGPDPDQQSLLMVQQKMQTWTMLVQLDATVVKEIGDTLKSVIQKTG